MADNFAMASQLAGQWARCGWYFGLRRLADGRAARLGKPAPFKPSGPVPTTRDLLNELSKLIMADAAAVRAGRYPASETQLNRAGDYFARVGEMLADVERAVTQRQNKDSQTASSQPGAADLPDYFTQDFHYQDGGYLSAESARLYDVQVDTLFMGASSVMRRAGLAPLADFMAGRDQRRMSLLDVACGTGRGLREYRLAFPAMKMIGLDLSQAYLAEARTCLQGLRPVDLLFANAEDIPLAAASQDIVTMTYLFHELPGDVRRNVAGEVARVLKPGGLFIFTDSLQMGDRPEWDGMLEAFPHRFHEPYFRGYAIDDLDDLFSAAGLKPEHSRNAFLSKVMVLRKGG